MTILKNIIVFTIHALTFCISFDIYGLLIVKKLISNKLCKDYCIFLTAA